MLLIVPHNAAVERRRAALSAAQLHGEMTHVRRAAILFGPSAATACYLAAMRLICGKFV
jgi:hypothetical protein